MRESSKHPRVEPSGVSPPPPFSTGTTFGKASADPVGATTATADPLPSTSNDFDIHRTLEVVMTVQVAHGQILVAMLDELRALHADLAHLRRSPSPPPFNDGV